MMIYILLIVGFILCLCFAPTLATGYLWYSFVVAPGSIVALALASMLLGRTNQYKLVKIRNYRIKDNSPMAGWHVIDTDETLYEDEINDVKYVPGLTHPYVQVLTYDLTGWRAHWLWNLHPPRKEYVLYLPKKDET